MRLVMMGTGTFAEPTFEAILQAFPGQVSGLVTQPRRESGRRSASSRQTGRGMTAIALDAHIPIIQPESINSPDGLAALKSLSPDLLVVAAYGQILKPDVINAGAMGAINVHASILPKYRGAAPVAHAILAGETISGVTIIRITTGLDAGEMLAQESLTIEPDETAGELESRLAPIGAKLAINVIEQLKTGPVTGVKQDASLVTKAPKLTKEMGLIDWYHLADDIQRQVRAMQPFPTAYTFFHRFQKPTLRMALTKVAIDDTVMLATMMQGDRLDRPGVVIQTIHGAVTVVELQPAGRQKMTGEAFARGYPYMPGDHFGGDS
jgi:methionyl-tRNA formyltransferase